MRKFYLINALMLLLTLFSSAGISAAVTTYPYSPDFKSDDGWTKTTTGNGSWSRFSGYWQATFYSGNSKAYLFSPELQTESGSRYAPVCTVDGRQAAQVMIICGCDNGTTVQLPGWRQNLRFAAAWERSMEGMYPGFTRPVLFSYRFYNQDLTTGSLLIEIGGHGNNLNEALYAGYLAAQGLADALLS